MQRSVDKPHSRTGKATVEAPVRSSTRTDSVTATTVPGFPTTRMRRNRATAWSRRLVAENVLTPADFIWPVFVVEGHGQRVPVGSMPGVERLSPDLVVGAARDASALGIPMIALFPYTDPSLRTDDGRELVDGGVEGVCRSSRPLLGRLRHACQRPRAGDGQPRDRQPTMRNSANSPV